ncbi:uncharacterized protein EV420DRAFT_1583738 [Desarmillaria tabescens]|uniref:Uncharacterized protein n=1 Tax=Armillaria tabescens TaxID=1929756 RepID=A0AA39JDR3_ARMTA|nr:uncharacterized protein EV420DRAFT_1583738 [Desarmillaria tabescens]KAK0439464.1 hypothetical protein EV420DRAFT_1583738 [Desarmillaria tabescens]
MRLALGHSFQRTPRFPRSAGLVLLVSLLAGVLFHPRALLCTGYGRNWRRLADSASDVGHDCHAGDSALVDSNCHGFDSCQNNAAQLWQMVSTTKGFFARDYSLHLGWNNVSLLQARVLQADLSFFPSFVNVCGDYATMVRKGDVMKSNEWEWKDLPVEQQMAWVIPIEFMLNITHLRRYQPVVTVAEYLHLHGYDHPEVVERDGRWLRDAYHAPNLKNVFTGKVPSLYAIESEFYDPKEIVRVDELSEDVKARMSSTVMEVNGKVNEKLREALPENKLVLDWDTAKSILDISDREELETVVTENGWEVVHTFQPVIGMDFVKPVVAPTKQVVPRSALRGFRDDFDGHTEDVVLLAGEVHHDRKPGGMRFTTRSSLDEFAEMILHGIRPTEAVLSLVDIMVDRMYYLTGDRLFMGAHMRRGDFVDYNMVMEKSPEAHIARVKQHLNKGRGLLASMGPKNYEVVSRRPPLHDDWFYVATDERNTTTLEAFQAEGAVFMNDLLTIEERRGELHWLLMLTDFRGVVEQVMLSRAAYFYGHAMSSVVGGVMNLRAVRGADPRTTDVD